MPPTPDGVEIVEATAEDSSEWLHLITCRYGLDEQSSPYLREIYRQAIGNGSRLWVARIDGVAVSKVGMHTHDGVAGIYGVATTELGRGRGLATLLTLTALHAARNHGIDTSVLHSTPMAHTLYAHLCYEDIATFEIWAEPGTLHL